MPEYSPAFNKTIRSCERCGTNAKVIDSRIKEGTIWRRRSCPQCGLTWVSWESRINVEATQQLTQEIAEIAEDFSDISVKLKELARRMELVAKLKKGSDT